MKWKLLFALCITTILLVGISRAADAPESGANSVFEKEIIVDGPEGPMGMEPPGPGDFIFISAEFGHEEANVKGAPYSAEAVTERTQVLQDGNHIDQKNSTQVYRDSEGRTRREVQFGASGFFAPSDHPHSGIFIHDPVKGERYVLDPDTQTARKMPLRSQNQGAGPQPPDAPNGDQSPDMPMGHGPHGMMHRGMRSMANSADTKTESLGKQTMEGVPVEGTRITMTIPEGQIGNDHPIQVVTEKWFSPDLQVNVMTRHTDPRFGTIVHQLKNINRTEPDKSLFQIPADYKVVDAPAGRHFRMNKNHQH